MLRAMSEFSSSLYLPSPVEAGVTLLERAGVSGVVIPNGATCALLVPWANYGRVVDLAPRLWQYDHAEDHGLWLREFREGAEVLSLDCSGFWGEVGGDPLGTSQASVVAARAAGVLSAEQADTLLTLFREGPRALGNARLRLHLHAWQRPLFDTDPEALAHLVLAGLVPELLGFTPLHGLSPDLLALWSPVEWEAQAPGAGLVG